MSIASFILCVLAFLGLLAAGAGFVLLIIAASRAETGARRTLRICAALVCVFMFFVLLYCFGTTLIEAFTLTARY